MYNEFLFFYKKEPYKQFIWRYIGQISPQIREKSSLGHFCHHFLYIKGNGKEGKVHFDLVYTDMAKKFVRKPLPAQYIFCLYALNLPLR